MKPKIDQTRRQRRLVQRIEDEAKETAQSLCEKFLHYFTTHDNPESQEVKDKIKEIHSQWIVYCKGRRLNERAFNIVSAYMNGIMMDYSVLKNLKKLVKEE